MSDSEASEQCKCNPLVASQPIAVFLTQGCVSKEEDIADSDESLLGSVLAGHTFFLTFILRKEYRHVIFCFTITTLSEVITMVPEEHSKYLFSITFLERGKLSCAESSIPRE